jgi:acyl-CoA synthetase (AMP-forming)/AMP-acid ligase II
MSGPPAVEGRFDVLPDLMDAAVDQIGDREAYVDGKRRVTFAEWLGAADALSGTLAELGVGPGDVLALHLAPSVEYAICYAAAARLGAITTGINPRLGPTEVAAILARCRPRVLVVDDEPTNPPDVGDATVVRRAQLAAATLDVRPGTRRTKPRPNEPVCIVWTSGTTGTPKGAWFDHRNLAAAVPAAGCMTQAFDRRISAVPMAHAGYMAKLWEQLAMGVTLVLSPTPWAAETMLNVLVNERITVGAAVPTQWAKLLELPALSRAHLPHLRIALAATAPAAPALIERTTRALGCPLVVRYAMTECPSITGTSPEDPPQVQSRTVGRAQDGLTVTIVDDVGNELPLGQVGRVRVRGACVMRGYWNDPTGTAARIAADGGLTSTDLGRFDVDGNLILVGRTGDMYVRGGYNIYPLEVENVIAENPAVRAVAVVGVPADVIGEMGVAFVVPRDASAAPSLEELRNWVTAQLADYKAPDRVVVVDELPLTAMAKVDKPRLRDSLKT